MRYRLSCDRQPLADVDDPDLAQLFARAHAGIRDRLDWQYDPTLTHVTIARHADHVYRIDIIPLEERR